MTREEVQLAIQLQLIVTCLGCSNNCRRRKIDGITGCHTTAHVVPPHPEDSALGCLVHFDSLVICHD